jgi:RNA-binding protein
MTTMTPRQRQYLKGLAHALKPILQLGKEGVTEAALRSIAHSLDRRELIKVKVLGAAPESAEESGARIARGLENVELVQVIGKTVVLYRPHPEKPVISLPGRGLRPGQ